jgi:hypothetical protein
MTSGETLESQHDHLTRVLSWSVSPILLLRFERNYSGFVPHACKKTIGFQQLEVNDKPLVRAASPARA